MAKRVKSTNQQIPITDWAAADDVLKQIGDMMMSITQAEVTAKDAIDEARAELAEIVNPINETIAAQIERLEAFAAARTEDFGSDRSRKLNFGVLGWRKSTSIAVKKNTLELIKEVFGKNSDIYIRTKEEVDKTALAKLTDEELAGVGAKRKVTDDFFAEPALPEAIDY